MKEKEILWPIIRAASYLGREECDYMNGDLLCCGNCHDPKEMWLDVGDEKIKVRTLCACEKERRDAEEQEELAKKFAAMKRDWLNGFESMTFAADAGSKATNFARKIIENWDNIRSLGIGFALYGGTGCGKTFAAACIANELVSKGFRAWMATASDIVDQFMIRPDVVASRLKHFDLVVMDDVGAQRDTEYATQRIYDAIDARSRSKLPLIVTTNLDLSKSPEDLQMKRIYSRIIGGCTPFLISETDFRTKDVAEKRAALVDILRG